MIVLGIETSCDETAASVVGPEGVLSDIVHTQQIHSEYGGVVPELAGRAHADKIVSTVNAALSEAGIDKPDAIAATAGPGLIGAVLCTVTGRRLVWSIHRGHSSRGTSALGFTRARRSRVSFLVSRGLRWSHQPVPRACCR